MSAEIVNLHQERSVRDPWSKIQDLLKSAADEQGSSVSPAQLETLKNVYMAYIDDPAFHMHSSFGRKRNNFLANSNGFSPTNGSRTFRITRVSDRGFIEARDFSQIPTPDVFIANLQRDFSRASQIENYAERQAALDRIQSRLNNFDTHERLRGVIREKNWQGKRSSRLTPRSTQRDVENIDYLLSFDNFMASTLKDRALLAAAMIGIIKGEDDVISYEELNYGGCSVKFTHQTTYAAQYYARHRTPETDIFNQLVKILEDAMRPQVKQAYDSFRQELDGQVLSYLSDLPEQATSDVYRFLRPTDRTKRKVPTNPDNPKSRKKIEWDIKVNRQKSHVRYKFLKRFPLFIYEEKFYNDQKARYIDGLTSIPEERLGKAMDAVAEQIWMSDIPVPMRASAVNAVRFLTSDQIPPAHIKKLKSYMPYLAIMGDNGFPIPQSPDDWDYLEMLIQIDRQISTSGIKPAYKMFTEAITEHATLDEALNTWMVDRDDGTSYLLENLRDYYESVPARLMMALLAQRIERAEEVLIRPLEEKLRNRRGSEQGLRQQIKRYREQIHSLTPQLIEQISYPDAKGFRRRAVQREIDNTIQDNGNYSLSGHMLRHFPLSQQLQDAQFFTANNQEMIDGLREIKLATGFSGHAAEFDWPTLPNPPDAFYNKYRDGNMMRRMTFVDCGDQLSREAYLLKTRAQAAWRYISENVHFMVVEKTFDRSSLALVVLEEVQNPGEPIKLAMAAMEDLSNEPEIHFKQGLRDAAQSDIIEMVDQYIDWANQQEFDPRPFERAREDLEKRLQPNIGLEARIGYKYKDKFNNRGFFRLVRPHIPEDYRSTDDAGFLNHPDLVRAADNIIARFVPDYEKFTKPYEVESAPRVSAQIHPLTAHQT